MHFTHISDLCSLSKLMVEMGVFVYECPRTGADNEGPAPYGRTAHSQFHCCRELHNPSYHSGARDRLATPGRRQDDKPPCQVKEWLVDPHNVHLWMSIRIKKMNTLNSSQDALGAAEEL